MAGRLEVTQEMVDAFKAEWERHDRLHPPETRVPGDRTRAGLEAVLDIVAEDVADMVEGAVAMERAHHPET